MNAEPPTTYLDHAATTPMLPEAVVVMADKMAEATADQFTGPMYELFQLSRQ